MKYELSNKQISILLEIINNANIKGSGVEAIAELKQALKNPANDKDENNNKNNDNI